MAKGSRRARNNDRKDIKEQILDAAERLFGEHGLDGVSLRQIAAAVGSANHFVVQYHFGDKAQLCQAIFERRLPSLDVARAKRLAEVHQAGQLENARALLEVILRPIGEELDAFGRRSYSAFLLSLWKSGSLQVRTEARHLTPITEHILDLLQRAAGSLPTPLFMLRLTAASSLFWSVLAEIDRAGETKWGLSGEAAVLDALDVGAAMLTAPVAPSVLEAALQARAG